MWYNFVVKKNAVLTTSLCAALVCAALVGGASTAFADGGSGEYPENFTRTVTFTELKDYAIGEDKFLFLDNGDLFELDGNTFSRLETEGKNITALNYKDGFYYSAEENGETTCYSLDGESADPSKMQYETSFDLGGFHYYETDSVRVLEIEADIITKLDGFTNLKPYGDKAYAVKENVLYELNGANYLPCKLEYEDYSQTSKILVGNTSDKLKSFNLTSPHFVSLNEGAYLTQIDITGLDGEFFKADATFKVGVDFHSTQALLLCKTGDSDGISVITIDGKCYIMRTDCTTSISRNSVSKAPENTRATATVSQSYMYSSPFISSATQLKAIDSGYLFELLGEVKKSDNPELLRDFYIVKLLDDSEQEVIGYVPFEYVSLYTFIEKEPETTPDPEFTEEDLVKPVILIIIVVALVLLAVAYLVYVGTTKKDKDKNVAKTAPATKDKKDGKGKNKKSK